MDFGNNIENILNNNYLVFAWAVVVIVLLLVLVFSVREKFTGIFRSAPINHPLPPSQLGIGVTSRFQQEFSSTNQGTSHVVGEGAARGMEHMMGSSEPPVYFGESVGNELNEYQQATSISNKDTEFFNNNPFYSDAFGNPEAKLKQALQGNI